MYTNIEVLKGKLEQGKSDGEFKYEGISFSYDDYNLTENDGIVVIQFYLLERETNKLTILM